MEASHFSMEAQGEQEETEVGTPVAALVVLVAEQGTAHAPPEVLVAVEVTRAVEAADRPPCI